MDMLPFFEWMEALPFSVVIRQSGWLSAIFNLIHLCAMVVLFGSILIVDLRLLGRGVKRQPLAQLARDARPWMLGALLVMLLTGIPQVTSLAMKQYYSPHFWIKMQVIVVALFFTLTVRYRITQTDEATLGRVLPKLVAIASLAMWMTIAVSGRLIGLLS
jgi:putative copper export protein